MHRDQIIAKLRQHAPALQAGGILHLALFGSTARDQATQNSDIDLMAEYDPAAHRSLLDICKLQNKIEDLLQTRVDLASRSRLRPIIKESAEEDAIDAF